MVVFKMPVEYNPGTVALALKTVIFLSAGRRNGCFLKFLWSIMDAMLFSA
jgi:hypothetical protein